MKLKLSFNYHAIINYCLIIILLLNLVILYYLYYFLEKQVYDAIIYEKNPAFANTLKTGEDINIEKFRNIINEIENKSIPEKYQSTKNIFY